MDILVSLADVNYLTVLIAVVVSFVPGFLWYSKLLFGTQWMAGVGLTEDDLQQTFMGWTLLRAFVALFVIGVTMALMFGGTGLMSGLQMGLVIGIGIVAMNTGLHHIFEQKNLQHYLIVVGHDIITFVILGAIIGAF